MSEEFNWLSKVCVLERVGGNGVNFSRMKSGVG